MKQRQVLLAVGGVIGGIQVEDDMRKRLAASANKKIDQVMVADRQALIERCLPCPQHRPFFRRQVRLTAGVGIVETVEGQAASQGGVVGG